MWDRGREGAEKLVMLFSIQDFGFERCFVVAICYSLIDVTETEFEVDSFDQNSIGSSCLYSCFLDFQLLFAL